MVAPGMTGTLETNRSQTGESSAKTSSRVPAPRSCTGSTMAVVYAWLTAPFTSGVTAGSPLAATRASSATSTADFGSGAPNG